MKLLIFKETKIEIATIINVIVIHVIDANDTFREILLEGAHVIIVKITSYNRYEQGVDFNISTNWLFDLGRGRRLVSGLYEEIAKYVKFKGISLHP